MAVDQLPVQVGAFARYLRELTARLDPESGWYAVFRQRDLAGLSACLRGTEIPPWDVVGSLLDDLVADAAEAARAGALHAAAAAAHDRRAGGGEALLKRLELMRREQSHAAERGQELLGRLAVLPEGSPEHQRLAHELSWTNDDHTRATARCSELMSRLAALAPPPGPPPAGPFTPAGPFAPNASHDAAPDAWFRPADEESGVMESAVAEVAERQQAAGPEVSARGGRRGGKRRPRGARYAWLDDAEGEDGEEAVAVPVTDVPDLPMGGARPRGARFGGGGAGEPAAAAVEPDAAPADAEEERAALAAVAVLWRLRAEGRSGEAHALLCEAAAGPVARLPVLAAELHRAGLGADWATLLWEVASLPPGRLAAAAGALAAAGRDDDCGQLLRQGVARPAGEIADAVLALDDAGARREADALLEAFLRVRTPEESAGIAATAPRRLVPQLLSAARAVSADRERDLVHALRVAGLISG
ncbi:UL36 very large tegument protein [Streptomyces sp. MS1.AVA.4]|uniref:UL36 very large tegument protein n=1 Tax=Streptomyces pratisoli TaxID=3139917 RepID=A0ACC6QRE1_9ACTN